MGLVDRLVGEWQVIANAPLSFGLAALASCGLAYLVVALLTRSQVNALQAQSSLLATMNQQLKDESSKLAEELTALKNLPTPPSFSQVSHGGSKIVEALVEIEEKQTVRFYGAPGQWDPQQLNKFAAFARLREMGAVDIRQQTIPTQTTVTSTSTAAEMIQFIKQPPGWKGGS